MHINFDFFKAVSNAIARDYGQCHWKNRLGTSTLVKDSDAIFPKVTVPFSGIWTAHRIVFASKVIYDIPASQKHVNKQSDNLSREKDCDVVAIPCQYWDTCVKEIRHCFVLWLNK